MKPPPTWSLLAFIFALTGAAARVRGRALRGREGRPRCGPAKYDRVFVEKFGPARAKRVMVLVPGFLGGAGDFRLIAQDIVRRVPGLQVWALDRRQQAFEDTSVFEKGDPAAAEGITSASSTSGCWARMCPSCAIGG